MRMMEERLYDCVFIDSQMPPARNLQIPGMDVWTATKQYRAWELTTKGRQGHRQFIVAMGAQLSGGNITLSDRQRARLAGVDQVLPKPLDLGVMARLAHGAQRM